MANGTISLKALEASKAAQIFFSGCLENKANQKISAAVVRNVICFCRYLELSQKKDVFSYLSSLEAGQKAPEYFNSDIKGRLIEKGILDDKGYPLSVAVQVLQDVLENRGGVFSFDPSHYTKQWDYRAEEMGYAGVFYNSGTGLDSLRVFTPAS